MNSQKPLKMYNLNVNVATALSGGGLLTIETQCNTPRTPEILNSLIAMSNPFDSMVKTGQENTSPRSDGSPSSAGSPLGSPTSSPPSVQHTCSQLIKEGLKLTLQSKRKISCSDYKEELDDYPSKRTSCDALTAEDEERRKRRRERNKIAATKCRMKKREKTANLVQESEILETQNVDLKTQIQDLEKQRQRLMTMLSQHTPNCTRGTQEAQPTSNQTFDQFPEAFLDQDFGDTSGLFSYSKDPNIGKLVDNFFPQTNKTTRVKSDSVIRGSYRCEEEDPDVYRPNGVLDSIYYGTTNDNGYNNFTSSQLDPGCRA